MSGDKTRLIYGALVKAESTYGTFVAPAAATDGVPLAEYPELTLEYGRDGELGPAPGTGGQLIRVVPSAPQVRVPLKIQSRGAGVAYSPAVHAPEHALILASGFTVATTTTSGSEKDTYTPTPGPGSHTSVSAEFYTEGEKWQVNGGYAVWQYEVENGRPALWTFETRGRLQADPTEDTTTAKTIVYGTVKPPIAAPLTVTLDGTSTLVVEKIVIESGRELHPRVSGQYGFHPGRRAPRLTLTIERPLFATKNFWNLWKNGTEFQVTFTIGSTQYNRDVWTLAKAQVIEVRASGDGARSMLEVTCALASTTPIANDDIKLEKT